MKGHLTSYKQKIYFKLSLDYFLLPFIFFKFCNKIKYLQHKLNNREAFQVLK